MSREQERQEQLLSALRLAASKAGTTIEYEAPHPTTVDIESLKLNFIYPEQRESFRQKLRQLAEYLSRPMILDAFTNHEAQRRPFREQLAAQADVLELYESSNVRINTLTALVCAPLELIERYMDRFVQNASADKFLRQPIGTLNTVTLKLLLGPSEKREDREKYYDQLSPQRKKTNTELVNAQVRKLLETIQTLDNQL